jgi:hypothetical protein
MPSTLLSHAYSPRSRDDGRDLPCLNAVSVPLAAARAAGRRAPPPDARRK